MAASSDSISNPQIEAAPTRRFAFLARRKSPAKVETAASQNAIEDQLEGREAELIVTAFRTFVLLLALGAPRILGLTGSYEMEEYWLAGVAGIYNIVTGLSCLRPGRYGMRRVFMVVMDMMLVTLWIRLSGQWELFPFYFLVVVVAAMWFKVLGGALAATFCNFFFLFLWSRAAADPELARIPVFTTSMALGALLLFLVGCLVGYIAEIQDKERERRLESQLLVANYQREIDLSSQLQPLLFDSQNQNAQIPAAQNLDIGVATKAARELGGGDYVDAIALSKNKTLICIADVSGKSVRAQARLPLLKYALRALAPLHHDPADLVKNLNETLAPDLQPELYIAFCCVVVDDKQGVLRWCNAGHIAPLALQSSSVGNNGESKTSIQPLATCGPPLGLFPETDYTGCQTKWRENDQLLLYTDGLSDALSYNNTEDGEAQVRSLALRLANETQTPISEVAENFVTLAGVALEAGDEFPERLRSGVANRLNALLEPKQNGTTASQAGSTPGHRDDITVVVVRTKNSD